MLGAGPLSKLAVEDTHPASYSLYLADETINANALIGRRVEIAFQDRITCRHCGEDTARSYGGGHCYTCFKTLARCDLCVVSPDRCHYFQGTCREPEWGEGFCMQPHRVYLANSAGLKVGITKPDHLPTRWLDQGATQALVVMATQTRQQAGLVEAALSRIVRDRTDWRALVTRDAPEIDLGSAWDQLARSAAAPLEALERRFPGALDRAVDEKVRTFAYPIAAYPRRAERLTFDGPGLVSGELVGIKGQYLLFESGVFNVRQYTSYHVEVRLTDASKIESSRAQSQMDLF